ncbi:MAG: peptidoglycan DD-metalloendopeptidase family protein [Planctomycetota bacterium]|jgi:lipoprotein NlpD
MTRRLDVTILVCTLIAMAGCTAPPRKVEPQRRPVELMQKKPAPLDYFVYEVQRGDTLARLGARFRVPWKDIAETNEILPPYMLRIGQPLVIPLMRGVEVPELPGLPPIMTGPAPRKRVVRSDLHHGKPSARFWWPTHGRLVRSHGDEVRGLTEHGIGIAAPAGVEVYAIADGTVVTVARADPYEGPAWGNVVAVEHSAGMVSWYAQLDRILVEKGSNVRKGDAIGTVGRTGAATRTELAFRLYRNERPVDPEDYLP